MFIQISPRILALLIIAAPFYPPGAMSQTWTACGTNVSSSLSLGADTWITTGARGEIRRSTDGGHTWTNRSVNLSEDLTSICKTADGEVFVLSGNGGVYQSPDAGRSWDLAGRVNADSAVTRYIDFVPDADILIVVDGKGTIYTSGDVGATWDIGHQSTDFLVADVVYNDDHLALASPEGRIQILRDLSEVVYDRILDTAISIRDLSYIDDALYVFGVRTDSASTPFAAILSSPDATPYRIYPTDPISIRSAVKLPGNRVLCVGGGIAFTDLVHAVIYYPLENRWESAETNLPEEYYSLIDVSMGVDSSTVLAGGEQGIVALAEIPPDESTITWRVASRSPTIDYQLLPFIETPIQQVERVNDSTVVLIAEFGGKGRVITSDDMGASWRTTTAPHRMAGIHLFNRDSGIGSRLGTLNGHVPEMLFLTDSLHNIIRERVETNDFVFSKEGPVHFSDGRILMGGFGYIYLSDDSGKTWSRSLVQDSVWSPTIDVVGQGLIYCLGLFPTTRVDATSLLAREGIYRSRDNGESWSIVFDTSAINQQPIVDLDYISEHIGLILTLDGNVLRTQDNWNSYETVSSFDQTIFGNLKMISDDYGYILGDRNFLVLTMDGGRSWQEARLWDPRSDDSRIVFRDVALMPDNRTMFIVGHGIILRGEFDEDITGVHDPGTTATRSERLTLAIAPNPLNSNQITVNVFNPAAGGLSFDLYDNAGRCLATWERTSGTPHYALELPADVPSGIYTLVVRSDESTGAASVTVLR